MGENYITCYEKNGSINISEDVISNIVKASIAELDGVSGLSNTSGAELVEHLLGEVVHDFLLNVAGAADVDAGHGDVHVVAHETGDHAGMGTGGAGGHEHMVEVDAHVEHLLHDFLSAAHVAESADLVGSAAGGDVGLLAFSAELFGHLFHFFEHGGAAGHNGDALHAEELEQEVVAGSFGAVAAGHAFFENEVAVEAFMHGPGKGEAAVVGLHGTAGDDGIGTLGEGVGNAEVELAGLVAAGAAGKKVVTLDVHVDLAAESEYLSTL